MGFEGLKLDELSADCEIRAETVKRVEGDACKRSCVDEDVVGVKGHTQIGEDEEGK